ncbi:MAG: hypothetical protein QOE80_3541, partial [Actinomycetota bacterium]|nr:hypothetical protein [Actinomycetota bacterium]
VLAGEVVVVAAGALVVVLAGAVVVVAAGAVVVVADRAVVVVVGALVVVDDVVEASAGSVATPKPVIVVAATTRSGNSVEWTRGRCVRTGFFLSPAGVRRRGAVAAASDGEGTSPDVPEAARLPAGASGADLTATPMKQR